MKEQRKEAERERGREREVDGYIGTHTRRDTVAKFRILQVSLWPSNPVYREEMYLQKENKD